MPTKVIMPKQGLQMTEGTITKWLVREGQRVEADKPLFEMETDKLSIEIVAPVSGILLKILKAEGETVPITEIIAVIGEHGEDISGFISNNPDAYLPLQQVPENKADIGTILSGEPVANVADKGRSRIFITPRAKMTAENNGINYNDINGSGPDGLIVERDILAASENISGTSSKTISTKKNGLKSESDKKQANFGIIEENVNNGTVIPFIGMRRIISERMMQSLRGMAQANHRMKVDMTEILKLREKLKDENMKVSITDILIKAVSKALLDYPMINSSLTSEGILLKDHVNMGMAVAVDNGLIVPVIRNSDKLTLREISKASAELADKAKKGCLKPEEYSDGTFTITNLGMFDIDEFTAIVNPPESAILAIGKIDRMPVVLGDDIVARPIMVMSLTYDHRIIDGAPAAMFLQRIKFILQNPYLMFVM
jgi:Pyruvate/2-oxoglutarate dehydrogenase complex, dihydrolipoamide acyltransferase (E2) component, and related enzymes